MSRIKKSLKKRLDDLGVSPLDIGIIIFKHHKEKDLSRLIDYFEPKAMSPKIKAPGQWLTKVLKECNGVHEIEKKSNSIPIQWVPPALWVKKKFSRMAKDVNGWICPYWKNFSGFLWRGKKVQRLISSVDNGKVLVITSQGTLDLDVINPDDFEEFPEVPGACENDCLCFWNGGQE